MIETLLQMMDYKKCGEVFYCGNDAEYKYFSEIRVGKYDEDESEVVYWIRTQAFASGYDIKKQNDTIRYLKNIVKHILRVILGKIDILKQVDWLKEQKADVILLYRIWIIIFHYYVIH